MSILNKYYRFFLNIWSPTVAFFVLTIIVATYLYSEYQADHANTLRLQSILLADELRQSSDDLTRMVRTYVATGDTLYKQHYQEILDIRNGKLPRPIKYENIYWDLVLEDDRRPRQNSEADPLLKRMQRVGFSKTEFAKLEQAKTNSDILVNTENAAMALIESTDPINDANRLKAIQMLNDPDYHQAKASIMRPINEFYQLMEQRTQAVVQQSNRTATILRMVFIAFTVIWVITLKAQTAQSKQAEKALADSDSLRELLLDIITQDLNNPAGVIYALSESGRKRLPENRIMETIFTTSERLIEVINQTTILSQAAFGETIPKEALSLNTLIKETVDEFAASLSAAEMDLVVTMSPDLIIEANPLIAEVFKNYISNAIKYARDGKRIVIETAIEDKAVVVCVNDFGRTIPKADRERYFRTQGSA